MGGKSNAVLYALVNRYTIPYYYIILYKYMQQSKSIVKNKFTFKKGCITLIRINKEEATELRKRFRDKCHIVRFCKPKSKRHHYAVSEENYVINALEEMRGCKIDLGV